MSYNIGYVLLIVFLNMITQMKQIYYLSFYVHQIDDCLTKIVYKNISNINETLYFQEVSKCQIAGPVVTKKNIK